MGWLWHHVHDYGDYKIGETQMYRTHKQKGWVVWCLYLLHKVLEIWSILTSNWKCLPRFVGKQPSRGEGSKCTWCHDLLLHNHLYL